MARAHSRHGAARVEELLGAFPVVVVTGARQVGKSTLAQAVAAARAGKYVTLDDALVRVQALSDPQGFVAARSGLTVIDEVQLVPELLRAVKWSVDRDRTPGRFLLTGSANLLRMKAIGESLAGRSAWFELGPMTVAEVEHRVRCEHLDRAFVAKSAEAWAAALPATTSRASVELVRAHAITGTMPGTLGMPAPVRRAWYDGYRQTFLERDLRQLAQIANLPEFARLVTLAALRTGALLNQSALASDAGLPVATLRRYLAILETGYQFFELPPFHANHGKRLVKTPKLYANDVGLAAHLDAIEDFDDAVAGGRAGALLETWAVNELLAIDRLATRSATASFFRTSDGREVDLVLERGRAVVCVEVKASATVKAAELRGLRELREAAGARFKLGIVAHLGQEITVLDPTLVAAPLAALVGRP